jgi:hypothetical protein
MNISRHTSYTTVYPTIIWFYQQNPRGGLPPMFNVVFFDKKGIGDFVLYSPLKDGPQSLVIGYQSNPQDYYGAYQKIYDYNPFLARVSISLIPGEASSPGQPTMASDFLLQKIDRVPQEEIEDIYADKFLKYQDIIEVEYSANYIGSSNLVQIIIDDSDTSFVNYFIGLEKLSVNLYQDTYYTDITTNGVITTLSDQIIYQFEKNYSIKLNQAQFENIRDSSFAIYDTFPLVPGEYKFSLLLKNTSSKEFTSFEKTISIPRETKQILMTPPLLSYDLKQDNVSSSHLVPFQINEGQLVSFPDNVFLKTETLHVFFQLHGLNEDIRKNGEIRYTFYRRDQEFLTLVKKMTEFDGNQENFLTDFPLNEFPASDYKLTISLYDQNNLLIINTDKYFSVAPLAQIVRPQIFSKIVSSADGALISYIQGIQYLNKGDLKTSSELLEKAHRQSPGIMDFAVGLGRAYLLSKQYAKIEDILLPFRDSEEPEYDVLYLLAEAKKNLSQYVEAIKYYTEIVSNFGLSLDTLNSLGICHYRAGNMPEARAAWGKSLEINADQPQIRKLFDSIKENGER